jgi:transcription elongation GreA/GreB family factor
MRTDDESQVVRLGSRVRIRGARCDDDEIVIVESPSNLGRFRLSAAAPLGRALLGHRAGDVVSVPVEGAAVVFTILEVDR